MRPDDIPQDVWDAAKVVCVEIGVGDDIKGKDCLTIARAILAERQSLSAQLAAEKARADKAEGERDESSELADGLEKWGDQQFARAEAAEANLLTATKAAREQAIKECIAIAVAANAHYASDQAAAVKAKKRFEARDFESMRIAAGGLAADIRRALSPESKDKGNG